MSTDLFVLPHKALRHGLAEVAHLLGRTDFADPAAREAAVWAAGSMLELLREHAALQARHVFPLLAARCPGLAAGLANDHALLDGQERRLDPLLDLLQGARPAEPRPVGRRLLGQWHKVHGHHLLHMEREEQEAGRMLQAHHTEAELAAVQGRLLRELGRERRAVWIERMLPALAPQERAGLVAWVRPVDPDRREGDAPVLERPQPVGRGTGGGL